MSTSRVFHHALLDPTSCSHQTGSKTHRRGEGQVLQSNIPLLSRDKTGLIPGQQRTHASQAVEEIIVFWTTDVGSAQLSQLTQRLKRLGLVI
jgi:hypothetical protein